MRSRNSYRLSKRVEHLIMKSTGIERVLEPEQALVPTTPIQDMETTEVVELLVLMVHDIITAMKTTQILVDFDVLVEIDSVTVNMRSNLCIMELTQMVMGKSLEMMMMKISESDQVPFLSMRAELYKSSISSKNKPFHKSDSFSASNMNLIRMRQQA